MNKTAYLVIVVIPLCLFVTGMISYFVGKYA